MAEYFFLGIDAVVTTALWHWYKKSRQSADFVKNAPVLDINSELSDIIGDSPHSVLAYAGVEGLVAPLSTALRSQHGATERGVIRILETTEHQSKRSQGFWTDMQRMIRHTVDTVPFALTCGAAAHDSPGAVHVTEVMEAAFLPDDLTVTYNHFEPNQSGMVERGIDRLFGDVSKGYQDTERMLQIGTGLLGFGELFLEDGRVKIRPPTNGPIYVLTKLSRSEVIRKLESKSTTLRVLTGLFGAVGLVVLCVVLQRWYTNWQARVRTERALEDARRHRLAQMRRDRAPPGGGAGEARGGEEEEEDDRPENTRCLVCLTNPREVVLLECGHVCICADCVEFLPAPRLCPICRGAITRVVPTFNA